MSIGTAIYAALVTGFIVLMITQLIDYERARKRDKRIIFEHQMELIREEREEQGDYHWGEVRVRVRRGRKAA